MRVLLRSFSCQRFGMFTGFVEYRNVMWECYIVELKLYIDVCKCIHIIRLYSNGRQISDINTLYNRISKLYLTIKSYILKQCITFLDCILSYNCDGGSGNHNYDGGGGYQLFDSGANHNYDVDLSREVISFHYFASLFCTASIASHYCAIFSVTFHHFALLFDITQYSYFGSSVA